MLKREGAAACRALPDALYHQQRAISDYLAARTVIDEAEKAGITRAILVMSLDAAIAVLSSVRLVSGTGKTLAESWLQTSHLIMPSPPGGLLDGGAARVPSTIQNQEVMVLLTVLMSPHYP